MICSPLPASHTYTVRFSAGCCLLDKAVVESRQVRVLYSTTLDKSLKASMTKIVKRLGGSVEDKEGPDFTHFVTLQPTAAGQADRGFKKSINALIALAAGVPLTPHSCVCIALACPPSTPFPPPPPPSSAFFFQDACHTTEAF